MSRTPDLDETALSKEQQAVFDRIMSGPRGHVVGPLRVWLQSPELADRAQALGQFVRFDSALPPILSELAILVTARIWSSGFEWSHHAPIARQAGLGEATIDAIAHGRMPTDLPADQACVVAFAAELHRDRHVSDATYAATLETLGTKATVDLVGICGYYTLISMTINAFEVPIDKGPTLPEIGLPAHWMFLQRHGSET